MGKKNFYKNKNMISQPLINNYSKVLNYEDLEFFTEDESIEILPKFSINGSSLIVLSSGTYGPFYPKTKVSVPLWLALSLRRENKCATVIPHWMNIEYLNSLIQKNEETPPLPEYYEQMSKLLLSHCNNFLNSTGEIKDHIRLFDLLKQYHFIQYKKYQNNLFKEGNLEKFIKEPRKKVFTIDENLSWSDINLIRPIILGFIDQYYYYNKSI